MRFSEAFFEVYIFSLFVISGLSGASQFSDCSFLNGCQFRVESYYSFFGSHRKSLVRLKCDSNSPSMVNYNLMLSNQNACGLNSTDLTLFINYCPSFDSILSQNLRLLAFSQAKSASIYLSGVKGINVESPVKISNNWTGSLSLYIAYSSIVYVDKTGRHFGACHDFERLNSSQSQYFIEWNPGITAGSIDLNFRNVKFYHRPVCDLLFANSKINSISLGIVYESFLKSNVPRFTTSKNSKDSPLNVSIKNLNIYSYDIAMDSRVLNTRMFLKLKKLIIQGRFRSIQTDLFSSFEEIIYFQMFYSNFDHLAKRQGIEWLRSMNQRIKIDLNNHTSLEEHKSKIRVISFEYEHDLALRSSNLDMFQDEDFCVYRSYPFNQLVLLDIVIGEFTHNWTCLFFWLFRFHRQLEQHRHFMVIQNFYFNESHRCNFTKHLELCDKKKLAVNPPTKDYFEPLSFLVSTEFLVILLSPVAGLIGIVSNSLVIVVLVNKKFKKEFEQKQYVYMIIYSACNILVCFFQIVSLINQCQQPFGLFCSSIRKYFAIQYMKLVFGEFFLHFFISMSNFTYVTFSLCRLSLVGTEKNPLVTFVSTSGSVKLIAASVVLSTGLSIIKPFDYTIDFSEPIYKSYQLDDFPNLFYKNKSMYSLRAWIFKLKLILGVAYDFVNYCVFVLVNIVVDLVLLRRIRRIMLQKEAKMAEQTRAQRKKIKKENRISFRKLVKLVFWNSMTGVLLKIPNSVTSLNDFRLVVSQFSIKFFSMVNFETNQFTFPYTMGYLCMLAKACLVFQSFGHFLYLISLTLNLFFLKRFDRNFSLAFDTIFSSDKNKTGKPKKDK